MPETTQPPAPDLAGVSEEALSAFIHAALFGLNVRPTIGGGRFVERLPASPQFPPRGRLLASLVTPDGEARVIEAMGERGWFCDRIYSCRLTHHVTSFSAPSVTQDDFTGAADSSPLATARAAAAALWGTASTEARALLVDGQPSTPDTP